MIRSAFSRRSTRFMDSDYESGGSAGSYSHFNIDSVEQGVSLDPNLIHINTLILMNPEYEFDTFMNDYLDVRLVNEWSYSVFI